MAKGVLSGRRQARFTCLPFAHAQVRLCYASLHGDPYAQHPFECFRIYSSRLGLRCCWLIRSKPLLFGRSTSDVDIPGFRHDADCSKSSVTSSKRRIINYNPLHRTEPPERSWQSLKYAQYGFTYNARPGQRIIDNNSQSRTNHNQPKLSGD